MPPRPIVVTGAAGFVGLHLVPALRAAFPAAEIIPTSAKERPGMRGLDVTDSGAVLAFMREVRPDSCVHLAAIAAVPAARRDPDLAWRINLHGTLAVAQALRETSPEAILLHVSSGEVYGGSFRSGAALDEAAPLAPLNTYAATKAAADLALGALAAEGMRIIRARPFNHTGPGQSDTYVVAAFARQIARIRAGFQEPVMRTGALDPRRDFLDVRDVCVAYTACLARADALPAGAILNIASGAPRRIGEILEGLLHAAGVEARVETESRLLRPTDIALAVGNADKARSVLGWSPQIPWQTTLRDVLTDWDERIRENPSA